MVKKTVPPDSTIASVYERGALMNAEDYVRIVLGKTSACRKAKGNAAVRIGVRGEGKAPNYRVEYSPDSAARPKVDGAYSGQGHSKLADDEVLDEGNWSTKAMTLEEVQVLLGKIRTVGGQP
ncbi:hypothetical protein [Muricoccus vinaceus]|uniref:Uncharacterized protein n=1 Tax=Muricoccus vinaceus TaxID=424704 RepID=A0ABV6IL64_9PROT